MKRLPLLFALWSLAVSAVSAPRPQSFVVTEGSGASAISLNYVNNPPQPSSMDPGGVRLYVDVKSGRLPLDVIGGAVDRLLTRTIARQPLPQTFRVILGSAHDPLIAELQKRLRQPGANWNLATGKPRTGSYDEAVRGTLASVLDQSAIGAAFRRHGYRLRLDEIARITQDIPRPRTLGLVPTHIDEIDVTAQRTNR